MPLRGPNPGRPQLALPPHTRMTPQRRTILDAVATWRGRFTIAELHERARRARPELGLATTYRTVELLRRTGGVHMLRGEDAPTYVRCRPDHHHHLVCTDCGSVEETDLCAAPSSAELERRYGFSPEGHELEIYGRCRDCA